MKILIVRFSALGDIVLALPALRDMAESVPEAELHFVTHDRFADLLEPLPELSRVWRLRDQAGMRELAASLREERFDLILDLHANQRSWLLRLLLGQGPRYEAAERQALRRRRLVAGSAAQRLFGRGADATPSARRFRDAARRALGQRHRDAPERAYPVEPERAARVAAELAELGIPVEARPIAIAPGAAWASKVWPRFAEFAELLTGRGPLLFLGGPLEAELCTELAAGAGRFAFCGARPLPDVAAALARCRCFVGGDTGLGHLAEAVGVPALILFGPTVPAFGFAPSSESSRLLERSMHCRPCSLHGSLPCRYGHRDCLARIAPEEVLAALVDMGAVRP